MKITQDGSVNSDQLKQTRKPKAVKAKKEPKDIRYMFRKALKEIDIDRLKKPWMAKKAFRNINTPAALQAWVDSVLNDTSRHIMINDVLTPVVALDTETMGLDTRIIIDRVQRPDGSWENVYEVNIELAGICLSSDGVEGIYIPINHEKQDKELTTAAVNIDRAECARILQTLFDRCHLIFYNAKYDREVLRLTMGINFRPYPHFEDVQVIAYINDPKADLGDKGAFAGGAGGLKQLSKSVLGIDQIELDEIAKVKADYCPVSGGPFCNCTDEQKKANKHTQKNHFAPFNWIPTDIALWYAAGDAICTWLLWKLMYELARSRKLIHRIDHELVESITWIERQRWIVDTPRLARTVKGHQKKISELREKLRQLAIDAGYEERATDEGVVLDDDKFNPGSTMQLQQLLYKVKGYEVTKFTGAGNPSCDAEVLEDLFKAHPEDKFLETIMTYRDYMALHPDNLCFDPRDHTARIYLKQNVVAGGRLAAAGGDFEKDGGFGLNPQGIKKVESYLMWKVAGNVLDPDEIPVDQIEEYVEEDLHPSCFREKDGVKTKAPGIIKNHIGQYMGYAICLVPSCTTCAEKFGILIPNTKMDANEMINLRVLFCAPPGWTLFTTDYCLTPNTRVLTSDLRWKPVSEVSEGEELVGFDEELPNKRWGRRSLHPSLVEHMERLNLPCVEITTDKGVVTCYENHKWLAKVSAGGRRKIRGQYGWVESNKLKVGQEIAYLCDTWEEDTSYEAGYLRGVYDGEGWVSKQTLGFGQKEGVVLDTTEKLLRGKGYDVVKDSNDPVGRVSVLRFNGGRNEVFKFLGSVRPQRLLNNVREKMWEGLDYQSKCSKPAKVLSVKSVGVQEVVAVRTSTHTFIAEGMLSHNCNIEMRCAANVSGEPEFINEFLVGKGDFHSLTASKVFPEFNDPNTSKAIRKSYRDLAKIINFALLYGGTEYTIFENMKKKKPDITWEEAKKMVSKYWEGVPVFFQFCQMKQDIAKNEMLCKTATGRVISFTSAMEAQHIHKPSEEEMDSYWDYRKLMKKAEASKKEGDLEKSAKFRAMADRMWKTPETGVRNAMDYNKFMGKIQRVSVNVPLQGLAGDFMRMALNRVRKWAESDPLIQTIFHLHCSVHDEIDFIVKNEYVPFVLPRITRLMKLRKLHEKMGWKVPIEADAEYGHSWDVEYHVTGDDDHKASAWTDIAGMTNYIPEGWDSATIKQLIRAAGSGDEHLAKVKTFLQENLHPRAFTAAKTFFEAKDDKARKKALIAAIQLDEFWKTDNVPDDEDDKLESFESYESRNELGPDNRDPYTPEFGYLGAIPLTATVKRPTIEILGEERPVEEVDVTVSDEAVSVQDDGEDLSDEEREAAVLQALTAEIEMAEKEEKEAFHPQDLIDEEIGETLVEPEPKPQTMAMAAHAAAQDMKASLKAPSPPVEDSVFIDAPLPRKKVVEVVAEVEIPKDGQPTYELVDLNESAGLCLRVLLGRGGNTIRVVYRGKIAYFKDKALSYIPEEYVKKVHGI